MILRHYYSTISFIILLFTFGLKPIAQTKLFEDIELNTIHNYRITQDHNGFIWMIGEKGITKYDGTTVRIFTTKDGLPTNDIWNIRITDDNKIWFFSSAKEHGYIHNDIVYKFSAKDKTTSLIPACMTQSEEKVGFYNNDEQLIELIDDKWTVVNNSGRDNNFLLNSDQVKSIYYTEDSIFIETNKNESVFITKRGERSPYFNIYPGNILFLSVGNTIQVIELNTLKIHPIQLDDYGLSLKYKIGISFLNNSYQLTGFNFVVDLDSNFNIKNINQNNPELESYYSMRDKLGNIWVASFNNGIYFSSYSETKSTTYNTGSTKELNVIENKIHFIAKKKKLGRLENKKAVIKFVNNTEHDIYTYKVLNKKIYLFNNRTIILDRNYRNIETTKMSSAKKFIKIKNSYYASHHYYSEELDSNFDRISKFPIQFKDLVIFSDTLFVAAFEGLFYRHNDSFLKHPVNFSKPINSIAISKNSLIIGSDGFGLFEYKNGKINKLFNDISFVEKVRVYNDTSILAATNRGLYSIENRTSGIEIKYIYNINDGLKSNLINDVLLVKDELYVATSKGITSIRNGVKNHQQLQSIYLNKIKWNGTLVKDTLLKVKYQNNNSLEVIFSTINYTIKNYLKFSYKLSPSQINFIKIPKGQINLNNLPIGEHKLIIKVENDKGTVLTKAISIEIEPNWYQTLLFKLIAAFLLFLSILVALLLYKKRVSKNSDKKIEQEKQLSNFKLQALRSQMNPHFVFNSLNAIQYYMNENDLEMSDRYLLKFSRLIRQFFDLSNVTEILLDKEIELLSNYLEIEKMRFLDKLEFEIRVDEDLKAENFNIPTMILQPIVENAINHGVFHKKSGGKVKLDFTKLSDYSYEVTIIDDGIGIKKSKEIKENSIQGHNSKSTLIFKERIALLNKSKKWKVDYTINNYSDNIEFPGTEVTIIFTTL